MNCEWWIIWAKTVRPLARCRIVQSVFERIIQINLIICIEYQRGDWWICPTPIGIRDVLRLLTVANCVRSIHTCCVRSMRLRNLKEATQNSMVCTRLWNLCFSKWFASKMDNCKFCTNQCILSAFFWILNSHISYTVRIDKANRIRDGKQYPNIVNHNQYRAWSSVSSLVQGTNAHILRARIAPRSCTVQGVGPFSLICEFWASFS